jgi:hypothetical protein
MREKMLREKPWFYCILTLLFLLIPGPAPFAQQQADLSFEGLTTIHVRIQLKTESDGKVSGLTSEQLQADAESLLADAGLKVVPQDEFERLLRSRGYPIALFDLDGKIAKLKDTDSYIYNLNFKVRQAAFLVRKPTVKFLAPTWELNSFGSTDSLPSLREKSTQAVAQFIQLFRTENPK